MAWVLRPGRLMALLRLAALLWLAATSACSFGQPAVPSPIQPDGSHVSLGPPAPAGSQGKKEGCPSPECSASKDNLN